MSKKIIALLVCLSLLVVIVCSCAANGTTPGGDETGAQPPEKAETQFLKFAASTMGAQWFSMAAAIGEVVNSNMDNVVVTATLGAADTNLLNIENGTIGLGFCTNDGVVAAAKASREPFKTPLEKIRIITAAYESPIQIAAPVESGVNSIYDVVGKDFNGFIAGGTLQVTVEKILNAHGITYDDIVKAGGTVSHVGYDEQTMLLQDRLLDVATYMQSVPSAQIVEVETSMPMHAIQMDADVMKAFREENPEYMQYIIPAGTYKGQSQDSESVSVVHMILCSSDLEEELVYNITKAIWENIDKISLVHSSLKEEMTLDEACRSLPVPLHPGAERYYKEQGVY